MPSDEELEKYKKADGSIDWGKYAKDQLLNNQLSDDQLSKKVVSLSKLSVFKLADELSDYVWSMVNKWEWFAKKTIGDQIVRSADSVGANIAEGYGRYFFKEYILFLYYARGSLQETWYWLEKAKKRDLITEKQYQDVKEKIDPLPLELNKVIKIVKQEAKKWKFKR